MNNACVDMKIHLCPYRSESFPESITAMVDEGM